VSAKPKTDTAPQKEREKETMREREKGKNLLATKGKESTGVVSKAIPSLDKGSVEILFGGFMHHDIRTQFRGGHIPEHAQL
jgi:hypothetical protein